MDALLVGVFGVWTLFSVIAQFARWRIFRFDHLELLPNCRFFTPQPIAIDVRVLVQSFRVGLTSPAPWEPLFGGGKRWFSFLWCPSHRMHKAVGDLLEALIRPGDSGPTSQLSYAYLVLLAAARGAVSPAPTDTHFRFMIVGYKGFEDPALDILFVSNAHRLQ